MTLHSAVRHQSPLAVIGCQAEDVEFDRMAVHCNRGVCGVNTGPGKCSHGRARIHSDLCVPDVSSFMFVRLLVLNQSAGTEVDFTHQVLCIITWLCLHYSHPESSCEALPSLWRCTQKAPCWSWTPHLACLLYNLPTLDSPFLTGTEFCSAVPDSC